MHETRLLENTDDKDVALAVLYGPAGAVWMLRSIYLRPRLVPQNAVSREEADDKGDGYEDATAFVFSSIAAYV